MIFSFFLFYVGKLPTDVINPILFPLLFLKKLNFLKFILYFWQKVWGQKDIFMYNVNM